MKYQSIYDNESIVYGLEKDCLEKVIDDAKFIEVTTDFKNVHMVRADSLKVIGTVIKDY